jgi:hypothetical protein
MNIETVVIWPRDTKTIKTPLREQRKFQCISCALFYLSDKFQNGSKHKDCRVSPKGTFRRVK